MDSANGSIDRLEFMQLIIDIIVLIIADVASKVNEVSNFAVHNCLGADTRKP